MSDDDLKDMLSPNTVPPESKDKRAEDFIRAFLAIEEAIAPFKDHLKDLRAEYIENEWLTKDEIKNLIKALRLHTQKVDPNDLIPFTEMLTKVIGTDPSAE